MHDELKSGIDRPRRSQYPLLVLIIMLLAIAGYFYRRSGTPLRGPGMETRTSSVDRVTPGVQTDTKRAARS